jgi:hypothetical protein
MKYKVGDTVRIQSEEWLDAHRDGKIFVPEMICYAGKIARLTGVSLKGNFHININNGSDGVREYGWAEWMFDPDYNPSNDLLPADDAIRTMLDGETLYDSGGKEWRWDASHCLFNSPGTDDVLSMFYGLYRRLTKHKRPMTRWEILNWTNSDESRGWVVAYNSHEATSKSMWCCPQSSTYGSDTKDYWKARLLPDLSGIDESTIQKFEVEE